MLARSAPVSPEVWRRDQLQIDVGGQRLVARMDLEDALAAAHVGRRDEDLAIEATRAQQRRVELVEQVGGGDDHHVLARGEAVHLDQQLVERLVALAADVHAAVAAHGVELVDEDDGRGVLARDPEQPPDSGRAKPGEHLHERRGRLRVEPGARFVRHRLGQQRLSGPRRAVEEDPLGHLRPQRPKPLGVAEVLDHLAQLLLGLIGPGDVRPGDRRRGLGLDLDRLGLRHVAHEREHGHDEQAHEQDGQPVQHERLDVRLPQEVRETHPFSAHRQWRGFTQPSPGGDSANTPAPPSRTAGLPRARCRPCNRCLRAAARTRPRRRRPARRPPRTP